MFELLFTLYILSGFFKAILYAYGIQLGFDLTLVSGIGVVLVTVLAYYGGKERESLSKIIWRVLPFFLLISWFAATVLYTPSESEGFRKLFLLGTNVIAFVAPAFISTFNVRRFVLVMICVLFAVGVFSGILYGCYVHGTLDRMGFEVANFHNKFYLSAGLGCAVAMLLSLFLKKWWKWIGMTIFFYLLLATAARGPILLSVISVAGVGVVIFLIGRVKRRTSLNIKVVAIFIVGHICIFLAIASSDAVRPVFLRTAYRFSVMVPDEDALIQMKEFEQKRLQGALTEMELIEMEKGIARVARLIHYRYAYSMATDNMVNSIFGYGIGSYGLLKNGEDTRDYPHNIFLEVWFESGLIGLMFLLFFLTISFLRIIRMRNWIFGTLALFLLLNAMKSYSIVDLRLMFGFFGLACFVVVKQINPVYAIEVGSKWTRLLSARWLSRFLK